MKKRGVLATLLIALLAATLMMLGACSQSGGPEQNRDSMNVQSEPVQEEEPIVLKTEPFYVLVVGDDSRAGTVDLHGQYADGKGLSDTTMLVRVDPKNYKLTLVSVPRDTTIDLDGSPNKINESYHQYGIDGLKDEIKKLSGVVPDYYLITNFVDFQKIVNELGGINVNVPVYESFRASTWSSMLASKRSTARRRSSSHVTAIPTTGREMPIRSARRTTATFCVR